MAQVATNEGAGENDDDKDQYPDIATWLTNHNIIRKSIQQQFIDDGVQVQELLSYDDDDMKYVIEIIMKII